MKVEWMRVAFVGVLVLLVPPMVSVGSPLDRWAWRHPRPQGNSLTAVTYGNGLFVAVGNRGTILTSSDGYHWTNQVLGTSPTLLGVAYSAGVYAAVGTSGTILTSTNGIAWTEHTPPSSQTLRGIAGNSSPPPNDPMRFFIVGDSGTMLYTRDLVTWVSASSASLTNNLRGVSLMGTDITVVGDDGAFRTFWQNPAPPKPGATNSLRAVTFGNGHYVFGGHSYHYEPYPSCPYPGCPRPNATLLSYQNSEWIKGNAHAWCSEDWFTVSGLAFGNGRFVAVGYTAFTLEYNYPGIITTSATGTNWTGLPTHTSENYLYGVAYGNGRFVAVGAAGSILVSSNGLDWDEIGGYFRTAITALAFSKDLGIASGQKAGRMYENLQFNDFTTLVSTNGTDWIPSTTNLPPMSSLVSGGRLFVGVGGMLESYRHPPSSCIFSTTNGFDWTSNCLTSPPLHGIEWGNGQFFAVGDSGAIFTSADAVNWSDCSVSTSSNFYCAAYGKGLYVAAGTAVATSDNGTSWLLQPTNPPLRLTRIVYGNGTFVAAGDIGVPYYWGGSLLSSDDGKHWQVRHSLGAYSPAPGLAYASGTFLAISGGSLIRSVDGLNWLPVSTYLPVLDGGWIPYYPLPYSTVLGAYRGAFIAGGYNGTLMQSGDTRVPILSGSPVMTPLGFTFTFSLGIGEPYRVQASTDFEFWEDMHADLATEEPTGFTDPTPNSAPARFFRVISP
jgi:hypothetical protein